MPVRPRALAVLAAFAALAGPARAQASGPATLAGWADDLRVALLDRTGGTGGRLFDRGLWRPLVPAMDHEYPLDRFTFDPDLRAEAAWDTTTMGFRLVAGSTSKARFAFRTDARVETAPGARHRLGVRVTAEESEAARRGFVAVGYRYRRVAHAVGVEGRFGRYKPDVDLSAVYTVSAHAGTATVRLEGLDVLNGLIFSVLGTDPALEDTVRRYARAPVAVTAALQSPYGARLRGEFFGGWQPTSTATYTVRSDDTKTFRFEDAAAWAGALAEARVGLGPLGDGRVGALGRVQRSGVGRFDAAGAGYRSRQTRAEAAAFAGATRGRLTADAYVGVVRFTDRQSGDAFTASTIPRAFAHRDRQTWTRLALAYRFLPAWTATVGVRRHGRTPYPDPYAAGDPYAGFLRFGLMAPNRRASFSVTFAPHDRLGLTLGSSVDLDGDPWYGDGRGPVRFDGAFLRLSARP